MSQLLNLLINLLVYSDGAESNNPQTRDIDYTRKWLGIATDNSFSQRFTIPPQSSLSVAQTARTLTQDVTTQYVVTLKSGSTYRFRHFAGTVPGLRTPRTKTYNALSEFDVSKTGDVVRYTWNGTGGDPNFVSSGVVVGDTFHVERGGNFNVANCGSFAVVAATDDWVEVINEDGVSENGIAVGPNVSDAIPMDYFSGAGVQVGDQAKISDTAFNVENRGVFTVSAVTSTYFEIANGNPGIPEGPITLTAAAGIVFYPDIYKWTYVEADRKVAVRINGDTSNNIELEPMKAGDPTQVAIFLHRGGVYQLVLVNNDIEPANVKVALSE